MSSNRFSILLITDDNDQAKILTHLIKPSFPLFFVAKTEDQAVRTIVKEQITIVLMGLSSLQANEAFYLHLLSAKENLTEIIRRKFLLCSKKEIRDAFSACNKEIFDDYFITRPLYDPYHILIRLRFLKRLFREERIPTSSHISLGQGQAQQTKMANLCDYFDRVISCEQAVSANNSETFDKLLETIGSSMTLLKQLVEQEGAIPAEAQNQIKALIDNHGEQKLRQDVQARQASTRDKLGLHLSEMSKIAQIKKSFIENPPDFDLQNTDVLVVEDDPKTRESLIEQLQNAGCQVKGAASAMDAVSLLDKTMPAYVLLDLTLPDMTPFFVINKLKGTATTIIVLARTSDQTNVEECLKNGAHGVITKPVDFEVLIHTIATLAPAAG